MRILKIIKHGLWLVALAGPAAFGQFLPSGQFTLNLSMTGVTGTPMNIAWNPVYQQYYGGGGGNVSDTGVIWNAAGGVVQTVTLNSDLRSFNYNPNTGAIEEITFSANSPTSSAYGYLRVNLNSSGLFTSPATYTATNVTLSGLPSSQVVPAYDAVRNLFYAFNSGNTVTKVSAATGLQTSTLTLDLASAGSPSLMQYSIGYDAATDALIGFTSSGGNRALAFSATTGAFLASISLSGLTSPVNEYGLGFANSQLFIYDGALQAYRGYFITSVPEPATASFLAVGLLAFAAQGWRLRRNRVKAGLRLES